jgi:hypothetical protein
MLMMIAEAMLLGMLFGRKETVDASAFNHMPSQGVPWWVKAALLLAVFLGGALCGQWLGIYRCQCMAIQAGSKGYTCDPATGTVQFDWGAK